VKNWQSTAIDNSRSIFIVGLIVYHSARVFDPFVFYVKSDHQFEALAPLILFGATWAMPMFFLAAGFALWHSLSHRGTGSFIRERAKRLLLPLGIGLVTLVPLQIYLARRSAGEQISYLDSMHQFFTVHFSAQLPLPVTGAWFDYSHLWFLAYLFAFSLILLPAVVWARRQPDSTRLSSRHAIAIWVVALLAAGALEARYGMEGTGSWDRWSYLVFMSVGILLAWQPSFGEVLAKRRHLLAVVALSSFVGLVLAAAAGGSPVDSLASSSALQPTLWRAGKGMVGMLFLMAIVGSLVCFRPKPAKEGRPHPLLAFREYLKPISLPLYLLHQTVIVALAYWIVNWPIAASLQLLAIVALTLSFSIATIELLRRTRVGCLFLGLKYDPAYKLSAPSIQPRGIRTHEPERAPALLPSSPA
jgi:peptidoglycan/LPS O-acetylase OafA/YrhL